MHRKRVWLWLAGLAIMLLDGPGAFVRELAAEEKQPVVREIFVPFKDLEILLESQPRRVLLSRQEYEDLLAKAKRAPEIQAPQDALLVRADYTAVVEDERVRLTGRLAIDVLQEGLHALPLDLSGVTLLNAAMDGRGAAIGKADHGALTLFVEGKGRHDLVLESVAPLETTAARQELRLRLPRPAAATLHLNVPGDVELQSGADVIDRHFDEAAGVTRFDLAPRQGDTKLVMTLNSHLARRERAVSARSVIADEVTEAYERLHATVSLAMLRRAVDEFRFALPAGFEVTEVTTPLLSRWSIETEAARRVLVVRLREQTAEMVVMGLALVRVPPPLDDWTMPRLEPLDVVGHAAVVGLLIDERLRAESIAEQGLIPVDTSVFRQAIPASVLRADPGAPTIRPVAAWYAPESAYGLSARFVRPPAKVAVTTNLLLVLEDKGQQARGGFLLAPEIEKLFGVDFSVPAGWDVTSVTAGDGKALAVERYGESGKPGRVRVKLAQAALPGQESRIYFEASSTPDGWLGDWTSRQIDFPVFLVSGAAREVGAIAVEARDDMTVRPESLEQLTPLDEQEKERYLAGVTTNLAYRYEGQSYRAALAVQRTEPRLTAATYSFLRVEPGSLAAHYELAYQVEEARSRQVAFLLPDSTPADLAIRGLDGVALKEFLSEPAEGGLRRWRVFLAEPLRGRVRLAVDFQEPLAAEGKKGLALPVVRAEGVAWQSGLAAVEGNAEMDVEVHADSQARRVDVGELAEAEYQPGQRLLGAWGFVGAPPAFSVDVARHPGYGIYPAIVQKAEFTTRLSADGKSETKAVFQLRSKATYLEVQLPDQAVFWSADLNQDTPLLPQRDGKSLLLALPATPDQLLTLRIVYQMPSASLGMVGGATIPALRLVLREESDQKGVEVPAADLAWHLQPPAGYEVVRSTGTVAPDLPLHRPAIVRVAQAALASLFVSPMMLGVARSSAFSKPEAGLPRLDSAWETTVESAPMAAPESALAPAMNEPAARETEAYDVEADKKSELRLRQGEEVGRVVARAPEPPPVAPAKPAAAPPATPAPLGKAEGLRSLLIDLEPSPEGDQRVEFRSLGGHPVLAVTLADRRRLDGIGWATALAVALAGMMLTCARARVKIGYLGAVMLAGTLLPLVPHLEVLAGPGDMAVYAAALLAPYYLAAGMLRIAGAFIRRAQPRAVSATVVATIIAMAWFAGSRTIAAEPAAKTGPYVIQVVEPSEPVKVPEDAVILPYDPESAAGIQEVQRVMVPYDKYVELWNLAYPEKKLTSRKPPASYALAGAAYSARLEGDEYLEITGRLEVDVYTDQPAEIPLGLTGAVLTRADLDGKPARLSIPQPIAPKPTTRQSSEPSASAPRAMVVLQVMGKGRHTLELAARLRVQRRGGWRVAQGALPAAPAAALSVTVPEAQTEVRLGQLADQRNYETTEAGKRIETGLGPAGEIDLQWRPKVAEGQVDRSLTVRSTAVLDVQEDGLRVAWNLALAFPRGQYEAFRVRVPREYLLQKAAGENVRGWEVETGELYQTVRIELLKPARDSQRLTIDLWRAGTVGSGDLAEFAAPAVLVDEASLQAGELVIRRSPLLDLRTLNVSEAARTDLPADAGQAAGTSADSPLGVRPYEAYRFASTSYAIRLAASPVAARVAARVQTVLKIAAFERTLESRVVLDVRGRPLYRAEVLLPAGLELDEVSAPGEFQWAVTRRDDRPLLTVYLAAGQQGEVPVVLRARLGKEATGNELALPRLEVLGLSAEPGSLDGAIAVQVDPAYDVKAAGLENCQSVLLRQVLDWLKPEQRRATRLAIAYGRPDYGGRLRLNLRQPDVRCQSISNVRVTERALEETILLDFTIQKAGIREVSFLLPASLKDARFNVPMLRQKTVRPEGDAADSPVLVRLELQDEVMDQLRVLVENDRLLVPGRKYDAPVPVVRTGQVERQFITLESAGRDEMVVDQQVGLEPVVRQQRDWDRLKAVLGDGITQAYVASGEGAQPSLAFHTTRRTAKETAGARIGLAQTRLIVDPSGAYRGEQTYWVDNKTEQYLQVLLPVGARLWTAQIWTAAAWAERTQGRPASGEPVKPFAPPGASTAALVRIPLVKTAAGDLDYVVRLQYGGIMARPLQWIGRMEFPLVQVDMPNLQPELSQVHLHLPEPYRFRFDGTMGQVTGEYEFLAGWRQYQIKKIEDLSQTLRQDSPFAQVRAAANLRSLKEQALQSSRGEYRRSAGRQLEDAFQQADRDIAQVERSLQAGVAMHNRGKLVERFSQQKTSRAKNVVQDLGANFEAQPAPQPPARAPADIGFNPEWLSKSQLANAAPGAELRDEAEKKAGDRLGYGARAQEDGKAKQAMLGKDWSGKGPGIEQRQEGKAAAPGPMPSVQRGYGAGVGGAAAQQPQEQTLGLVNRYHQRLADQQAVGQRQAVKEDLEDLDVLVQRGVPMGQVPQEVQMAIDTFGLPGPQFASVGLAAPPALRAAGLASLEVEFPIRGRAYLFSTPQGDTRITAWTVSTRLIDRIVLAAIAVLGAIVLLYLVRQGVHGRFDNPIGPTGSTLLIVAGLLLLVFLPVLGLVALLSGMAIKLHRTNLSRAERSTPA